MACTYDITTDRGKVRFLTGDTSTTACIFSDAEIDEALSMHSGDITQAAITVIQAWLAKYALLPETEKIGDYSYSNNVVAKFEKLIAMLMEQDASSAILEWSEPDYTEGSAITSEDD